MDRSNIALIGMPGIGKSTVALELSKLLGRAWIDTDTLMKENTKRPLDLFLEECGWQNFIELERKTVCSLLCTRTIVATGGSVVLDSTTMDFLKKIAFVVYLDGDYDFVERRLGDWSRRAIVKKPEQSLFDVYSERVPLFLNYADVTVRSAEESAYDTALRVAQAVSSARGQ